MRKRIPVWLLLSIFAVLYLVPLETRPLFIPDETRYAEIPREMIQTGNWVVPRLNGMRYFEKPVLGYWLSALSLKVFGENNFAVRFPSALSTGLTAALIYFLCVGFAGNLPALPGIAVLIYLSSLGVNAIGGVAVLDTPLTFFLAQTLGLFFVATEQESGSGKERWLLLLAGGFAGLAFLTKGFLAFVVPVVTAGPYLLLTGRWKDIPRLVFYPVAGAVGVSMPWSILIHLQEPDFWNYFFWNEHVRRFLADNAQHKEPFWFFLAVLPAMFLPWTFLLPAAISGIRNKNMFNGVEKRFLTFCLCWFSFSFIFFSASSGKLSTYILPCFPPLAIMAAMGLQYIFHMNKQGLVQWGMSAASLLALLLLCALSVLYVFGPKELQPFQSFWKWSLLSVGLILLQVLLLCCLFERNKLNKILLFGAAFSQLFFIAHFTIPNQTLSIKAPGPLLERNATFVRPDTSILTGEETSRAVSWYLKRDDVYLVEGPGELQYGANFEDSRHRVLSPTAAGRFLRQHPGRAVLVARYREYKRWQPYLPEPTAIDTNGKRGYLFLRF